MATRKKQKKTAAEPIPHAATWAELRRVWAGCKRCKASKGRKLVVFGAGPIPADIMLIGKSPGRDEDIAGLPVRGVGGQYTYKALLIAGIPWEAVFFDNVLACKVASPLKAHIDPCSQRLEDTVAIVRPKLIIGAGAVAAKWLSKTNRSMDSLSMTRGEWNGIPTFYTVHPMEPVRAGNSGRNPDGYEASMNKIRAEYRSLGRFARELGILPPMEE